MRAGSSRALHLHQRQRMGRMLAVVLAVAVLLVVEAPPALAHANLVATTPAQKDQLDDTPSSISFTFDERVDPVEDSLQLIDSANRQIPLGDAVVADDGLTVQATVDEPLDDSSYLASIRAVSLDSHVVAYSIQFTVGEASPDALHSDQLNAADGRVEDSWSILIRVARGLGYTGMVLAVGLLAARVLSGGTRQHAAAAAADPRGFRTLVLVGAGLLITGAGLNLLVQGPYSRGEHSWLAMFRLADLDDTLATPLGLLLTLRICVALLLAGAVVVGSAGRGARQVREGATLLIGAVLAWTFAAGGHAAVGADSALALVSTAIHVLTMAVWLGGIVALVVQGEEPLLGHRWSHVALVCLVLVLGSGIYQSARRIYPLESLWQTDYGLLLLGKTAGAAGMAIIGLFVRRRWIDSRFGRAAARLDAGLGAAILAVTAVLATSVPARDDYGPPLSATAALEQGALAVHADSTRRGPVTLTLRPDSAAAQQVEGISATLSSEAAGVERLPVRLDEAGGVWTSEQVILPSPGEWTVSIVVDDGVSPVVTAVRFVVW